MSIVEILKVIVLGNCGRFHRMAAYQQHRSYDPGRRDHPFKPAGRI